ncbi:AAA family ATPase [Helicobacter pylori]|uniref:AAA family ATPase n=1 Tax=Helicobacter pylori TaxID=210 RepID=UPI000EAD9C1B|nr:AAA family ATPase [Helicobacter pylori]
MEFYKRVLKLHHFRNLGRKSPTELLLNSSFGEKHGGLVVLVGENNVGKSNVLEALTIFNDADVKLCREEDYFKDHEKTHEKDTLLSLEEETILDHKITGFSCVDLKIQSKEVNKGLKELSKTLISYPFEKHVEALGEQCSNSVYIPTNNNDYSNICTLVSNFINLITSYNSLGLFLHFYKEKLKLSDLVTEYANATNNLFFKELIKYVSGNSEGIKTFCQCIKEIKKCNTPDKKYNTDEFFVMGQHKQNQLEKIYSCFKKLSEGEIKPQNEDILKKLKSLDEIFKTTDFTKFTPETEVKDIIKEIDEKYPINENFKQQFRTFRLNIGNLKKKIKNSLKYLEKTRKDFERKKELLIREIENDCKNQKVLKFNYDVLLDNIQQICKNYIASHAVNDVSKDIKSMMCQLYLKKIDLLVNSEIEQYRYNDFLESARKFLWEDIKTLDEKSGVHLFPKNIGEIKDKFEANKEKVKQSKNYFEFAEYCRECNPYTAFQNLRNKVQFPLSGGLSYKSYKLVPTMKEYKEPKITDNDLKTALFTCIDYSSPSEFNQSDWFFRNSLFRKIGFHPNTIWNFFGRILKDGQALQIIMFDKNNDLVIYDFEKSFNIPKKYLQEIDQESLKEIRQSEFPFNIEAKGEYNNNVWQLEFLNDKSSLLFKVNFTEILESLAEILEYNMQLKIDSLITKEFNRLLAIAEDSSQNSYQLKIHVRHNNKFYDYSKKSTAYEIKLEIHDCRKSDNQKPIILSQQSTGFQWAFNFMFGFLYNVGSNFSFNKNIIYVMDEPATHLSVPARKEFRKFLKEYAHKNHVTFVVATHDPFLVDTDHLDEIRIVEKETEGSAIENHFNYPLNNAGKDSDALDKIKRSLGVGQHVFHNPQKHRIVFVEGITDYCYLSAFKLYFNECYKEYKDNPIPFTFLPISGLKNNPNKMKETIQKLCELDNNPIILTDDDRKRDSDQNATSERFKRANKYLGNPITILQLSDCDRYFKQIEDCFSANDRNKYAKNKQMELAMAFKTRLLYGEKDAIEKQTKRNFLKLFKWIAWATNLIKN